MTFVPEDGTGLPNANSYAGLEFADAYFGDRGNTEWSALTPEGKEQSLVRATDYIDRRFRFIGQPLKPDQALQFPRQGFGLPVNILKAACEYALRASTGPLAPDPAAGDPLDPNGRSVASYTKTIGPLTTSISYFDKDGVAVSDFPHYPEADALLKDLILVNQGRVIR